MRALAAIVFLAAAALPAAAQNDAASFPNRPIRIVVPFPAGGGVDYIGRVVAKGLSERTVLWKHVMRNALIPLVTGFPAAFVGAFFTGSLLIETLFSLDGLGLLSYESVMRRDYPVVFGTLYLFTLIGLFTKLISDLCYVYVDPRIQFGSGGGS